MKIRFTTDAVIIDDSVTVPINDDLEFVYNNVEYVVFVHTINIRKHSNEINYIDIPTQHYGVISKTDADRWINLALNVCQYSVSFESYPPNRSIADSLVDIKNEFYNIIIKSESEEIAKFEKIMQLVYTMLEQQDSTTFTQSLMYQVALPQVPATKILTKQQILEYLSSFISNYCGYNDNLILNHTLDSTSNLLYLLLGILLTKCTHLDEMSLLNNNLGIVNHYTMSLLVDTFTDRCSKELYINGRLPEAKMIVDTYRKKYPALTSATDSFKLTTLIPKLNTLMNEISQEPTRLLPYILTFNFSDHERIKYIYNSYVSTINKSSNNTVQMLSFDSIMNLVMKPITENLINTAGFYTVDSLLNVLNNVEILEFIQSFNKININE